MNPSPAERDAREPSHQLEPDDQREFQRVQSKQLFGNRDRMEIAVAVARTDRPTVSATELSNVVGLPANRVHHQLKALAAAGLLDEMPRVGTSRIWIVRRERSFWDTCLELSSLWERDYRRSRATRPE